MRFILKDKNELENIKDKYEFIFNILTGGDDDIILLDELNKEYCFGEHGTSLVSINFLEHFQKENAKFTLKDLIYKSMNSDSFLFFE